MKHYKKYARNKRYVEGSIAESIIIMESTLYCKEYMPNSSEGNHKRIYESFLDEVDEFVDEGALVHGKNVMLNPTQYLQARRWVLQHSQEVQEWRK